MSDILAEICARKRQHVAERKRIVAPEAVRELAEARNRSDPPRGFRACLEATSTAGGYALIAEIKKASPSRGLIRRDFDPPALARAYGEGGAACLSVLTDTPYFQGEDGFLDAVRAAVDLPLLRKDFMLDPYQVFEARALGADCILLIMAALDDTLAVELEETAISLGMDVLIETHDRTELTRALALRSPLIGINNRDLRSLTVDLAVTERLAPLVPAGRLLVAESGLHAAADLARMAKAGAGAFLVGESLMREADVATATRRLLGQAPRAETMRARIV